MAANRKRLTKEDREAVYEKYNGRCAYCGCELEFKDMQVDHIEPFAKAIYNKGNEGNAVRKMISEGTMDNIENLMPSCRSCNFYKGGLDIGGFRRRIREELSRTCIDSFQARLAMKYGMIIFKPWDEKFWFEKITEKQ